MNLNKLLIILLFSLLTGCSESSFYLAEDSRLPLWIEIPEGEERNQYAITLSYYFKPSGRVAVLELTKKGSWWSDEKIMARPIGLEPIILKASAEGFSPSFEVVSADDIIDIIEHRISGPIFYMTDDPEIWRQFRLEKP